MISSSFKLLIDIAIAIETASGRPSGTEAIRITTPTTQILIKSARVSLPKTTCEVNRVLRSKNAV